MIAFGICGLAMSSQAALVAHYNFNEGAGATVANDQLGNNHGVVGSAVTTGVLGISGNAYQFSYAGANPVPQANTVDMGNASFFPALTGSGELTLSAWIKTTDTTANRNTIIYAGSDTVQNSYVDLGASVGQAGQLNSANARLRPQNTAITEVFSTPTVVNDDQWHHLAMTIDLAGNNLTLYVDGALSASSTLVSAVFPAFNNFEVGRLGRYNTSFAPVDPFNGLIDDVQVYDEALSLNQVNFLSSNPGLTVVPEPSTLALLGLAGLALIHSIRRKR